MLGRRFAWASSNPSVASVTTEGLVTGTSEGSARITATSGGRAGTAQITVAARPAATVVMAPRQGRIGVGETLQLSATARDDRGAVLDDWAASWSSDDQGVATVTQSGLVTGVAPGSATVSVSRGGVSAAASILVEAPDVVAVPADPRPEIEALIESYRRAIESRDLSRLRQAYPGMTEEQEHGWRDFFGNVTDLSAELRIVELEQSGDEASANVETTYRYRTNHSEERTFVFTATFSRTPRGWRMTAVR